MDAAEREGPALIVAVDGRAGAGKSTLVRALALLRDDLAVIEGDDFYRPLPGRTREALTPIEAVDLSFGWERLRDEALGPLLRGETARFRRYDRLTGRLGEHEAEVAATGVVVVEGAYVARPALRGYLDLIVVVDAPRELCAARLSARGEWTPAEIARRQAADDWYLGHQDPRRGATVVVDGAAPAR